MPQNILLITCDQLRKDALGCYGNTIVHTPNIDSIAANGIRYERTFTAYPVCAPNRGSLATGRYPSIHGLRNNGIILPGEELTLMEVLHQRGYATYGVGKMHFGPQWQFPPDGSPLKDPKPAWAVNPQPDTWELPWYGFDDVQITEDHRVGPYADYLAKYDLDVWSDPHSFTYPQHICVRSAYPQEHHQTAWIGDRSLDYLDQHPSDQPFFMWTSFVHPHHPFNPPAPYDTMYDPEDMPLPRWLEGEADLWPESYQFKHYRTTGSHEAIGMHEIPDTEWQRVKAFYYGMITFIDVQVGRLIDALDARGMLENTLIVFTSDHGEMLGDHHLVFKGTTYDEVTNVPLIISSSDHIAVGEVRETLSNTIDIMPTLLDCAGIPIPVSVQGKSLVPSMRDTHHNLRDAVLIENAGVRRSVRTADGLLTWHGEGKRGELYDLNTDPYCQQNLWDNPSAEQLQHQLTHKLIQLMAENVDPLPPRVGAC